MSSKRKVIIIVLIIAIAGAAVCFALNKCQRCYLTHFWGIGYCDRICLTTKSCGDITLEGYLSSACPWQAYPWLGEIESPFDGKCSLDVWLLASKPEDTTGIEICYNRDGTDQPLTTTCFLDGLTSFDPWGETLYQGSSKVTLIGSYEKMEVCYLRSKCLEPECFECAEQDVFVPCEIIED